MSSAGAAVIRVDLERLAACVGCSAEELVAALKQESTTRVEGEESGDGTTVMRAHEEHDDDHIDTVTSEPVVQQALLSAATRPTSLDTETKPRQLIQLGGATGLTVIEIILHNLWKAGIKRVVVLIAPPHGAAIMDKINKSPVARKLSVEFMNVGGTFAFQAKALLAAKPRFQGQHDAPFLLCSSDHIYDPALVKHMATAPLGALEGRVLIEEAVTDSDVTQGDVTETSVTDSADHSHRGEAPKGGEAVHVIREGALVKKLWRGSAVIKGDAYEAGLYTLRPSMFGVLEKLEASGGAGGYYTLCEAVDTLASEGTVGWAATEGKSWLAIETREQLEQTQKDEVEGLLADTSILPWHCAIARNPSHNSLANLVASGSSNNLAAQAGAAAAAAAAAGDSASNSADNSPTVSGRRGSIKLATPRGKRPGLLVVGGEQNGESQSTVTANETAATTAHTSSHSSSGKQQQQGTQRAPAFLGFAVNVEPLQGDSSRSKSSEGVDLEKGAERRGSGTLMQFGGTGIALDWSDATTAADRGHCEALLVPLLGQLICPELESVTDKAVTDGDHSHETDADEGWVGSRLLRMQSLDDLPELPSDIERIALTTIHEGSEGLSKTDTAGGDAIQLQLLVTRKVPLIGIVILFCAALGDAFSGPSAALLTAEVPEVHPIILSVWRFTITGLIFLPFFLLQLVQGDAIAKQIRDPSIMIPNIMQAACTGAWGICFFTALKYTTVPLASLFASTAPLLLVLWKAVTGNGVTLVEGVGVGIAMTGSVLCALGPSDDDSSGDSPSASSGSNSMLGILFATSAALATAIYIKVSKGIRPKIAPMLFMLVGRGGGMLFILAFAAATLPREELLHPSTGWLGWASNWKVARTQIFSSILGDVVGSFGYFVTLKYLSPIVVATCTLLNPVTATAEQLMLGLGSLPGLLVSAGAGLILFGAGMVMLAASKPHDEVIDATIATSQLTVDTNNSTADRISKLSGDDREPLLGKRDGTANSSATSVSSSIAPSYGSTTQ